MDDESARYHLTHSRNTLGTSLMSKTIISRNLSPSRNRIGERYEQFQNREYKVDISKRKIKQNTVQLESGKAVGADEISSEHYTYALDTSLPLHLGSILAVCLRYGTIIYMFTWYTDTHIQESF